MHNRCKSEYRSSRFQLHMPGTMSMLTVRVVCSSDMAVLVEVAGMWNKLHSKDVKCRRLNDSECAEQGVVEAAEGMVGTVGTLGLADGEHRYNGTWQRRWEL